MRRVHVDPHSVEDEARHSQTLAAFPVALTVHLMGIAIQVILEKKRIEDRVLGEED